MAAMFSPSEEDDATSADVKQADLPTIENLAVSVDISIVKCWNELKNKPICICFDLDYTLWPMLIDKGIK